MATVCAGTLALMDGGIKLKTSFWNCNGFNSDQAGKYAVLSDILMKIIWRLDFKVTGTEEITACQMDIKVNGLDYKVLEEALSQAKDGRLHILEEMMKTLPEPRKDFKAHVPRIENISVPEDAIGGIIGKGVKLFRLSETKISIGIGDAVDGMQT